MEVLEYIREDGSNPYKKWFDSLDAQAAAKVAVAKARLELGNTSNIKWFSGIGEYRINWGPGYRIYLAQEGKEIIILWVVAARRGRVRILIRLKNFTKNTEPERNELSHEHYAGLQRDNT